MRAPPKRTPSEFFVETLSDDQVAQADQVGLRLADALRAFFEALPQEDRSVRGAAQILGVDRNICQRGMAVTEHVERGTNVLTGAPGVEGLDLLADAGERVDVPAVRVRQLRAATKQLRRIIETLGGGSRRGMLRRLDATLETSAAGAESESTGREARVRLFREAAQITGYQCASRSLVGILSPLASRPDRIRHTYLGAFLGYRARAGSLPLTIKQAMRDEVESDAPDTLFRSAELVEHLCSSPPPSLSVRDRDGEPVNIIDAQGIDPRRGADVVVSYASKYFEHPAARPPEVGTCFTRIGPPMTRLVFDIYAHSSLVEGAAVHASAHAYGGGTANDPLAAWDTQLPGRCVLELLGQGLENAASDHWRRHAEATAWMFEKLGLDAREHTGYRLDVEFPVWGADYVIWFDYRKKVV